MGKANFNILSIENQLLLADCILQAINNTKKL